MGLVSEYGVQWGVVQFFEEQNVFECRYVFDIAVGLLIFGYDGSLEV